MSQKMTCRPSEVLGVDDRWVAFCLDRAVHTFANAVEQDQELAVTRLPKTAKPQAETRARQRVLDQYLGVELASTPHRFRAPSS